VLAMDADSDLDRQLELDTVANFDIPIRNLLSPTNPLLWLLVRLAAYSSLYKAFMQSYLGF
jgi:hypothetical protein